MAVLHLLLLLALRTAEGKNCPPRYNLLPTEELCVMPSPYRASLDRMESFCGQNGGVLFNRRMSDKTFHDMAEFLGEKVKSLVPDSFYTGMKKDSGFNSKTWIYSHDEGSVEQDDYPLWASKPMTEDCGLITRSEEFKVTPIGCNQEAPAVCEKNEEPCIHQQIRYVKYYGLCLGIFPNKETYMAASYMCADGHLYNHKNEDVVDSVATAIYNMLFDGGLYVGLQKQPDGKWLYDSGEEENDRWSSEEDKQFDCGVIGVTRDLTLAYFTMDCSQDLVFICEYVGSRKL